MTAPLDGIIVVALEQAISAPLATRHLADLGARVLKVEHPDGGDFARGYDSNTVGQSTYFVWANRGKDSIVLDLKAEADRAVFDELVAGADVFIQNLSHAAAQRAGVLAAQLVERHPRLIACDISGYGPGGPRTDDKAYDLAIQAEAGAIALNGSAEHMAKVGISVADIASGMYALSSILAAIHRRSVTGEGAAIELSMLECLAEWTSPQVLTAVATGRSPGRSDRRHPMIAPYGIFELDDGSSILVAVQADREWRVMAADVLGRPELADDPRFVTNPDRIAHVEELESLIRERFALLGAAGTRAVLTSTRITYSAIHEPLDVWHHEQLVARDRKIDVETATGTASVFKPPFNIGGHEAVNTHVPALGAHDESLLAELRRRAWRSGHGRQRS